MNPHSLTRLNKYISESGLCSRREADKFIESGRVFINGKKAKIGDMVAKGDKVVVNGHILEAKEDKSIIIALNKPVGITSTTEAGVRDNIVDYVHYTERIFPIGRLDKDSQGLIFLTNNGDIVNKILRAGNNHEKEYLVTVDKPITDHFISAMSNGVPIMGETTKKCKVTKESPFVFRIVLIQGLNRQIRRMCEYFGYQVTKLERIRIMNISLKGIPTGDWRELTEQEVAEIFRLVEHSSSTVPEIKQGNEKKTVKKSGDTPHKKTGQPGKSPVKKPDPSTYTRTVSTFDPDKKRKKPNKNKRTYSSKGRSGGKSKGK